jgi:hypothetical protein
VSTENPYIAAVKVFRVIESCKTHAQLAVAARMALRTARLFGHDWNKRFLAVESFHARINLKRAAIQKEAGE